MDFTEDEASRLDGFACIVSQRYKKKPVESREVSDSIFLPKKYKPKRDF